MFGFLRRFFAHDIAMDLGTANTLLSSAREDMLVNEPSVVALDADSGAVLAVGAQAKAYLGRTPRKIRAVRPMKDGVIADFDVTREMIAYFVGKAIGRSRLFRPSMVISIPSGITQVEKKAVIDAALLAGAGDVRLIEEPMAAAIGAGIDVEKPEGSMIVDIGGGTAEVAVVALSDIVTSRSVKGAGDSYDEAIINYVRKKYNLLIGERTAEDIKIQIGSAYEYEGEGAINVKGRNLIDGLPKDVEVTAAEIREALKESVYQIIDAIKITLENTPPELAADIIDNGITLTGGGAQLRGLEKLIEQEVKIPVTVADNPLDCVVEGTGICLEKRR